MWAIHITSDTTVSTGRINIDFSKDGSVWNNPTVGSQAYVKNMNSGVTYTVTQNPDYAYAYRTADTLPYGTYGVYLKHGSSMIQYGLITLNAANVWVRPAYYTLTYYANGATSGSVPAAGVYVANKNITVAGQNTLAKTNYTFAGWKTAASSGTAYAAGSTITISSKTNLYAQWNLSVGRINIDFYKDGSVWNNPTWGSQAYVINKETGVKYTVTQNPDYPYAYRTADTLPYGDYQVYLQSGSGIVLYGTISLNGANMWTSPAYYTLTYYANGATSGTAPAALIRLKNQSVTVSGQNTLARTGYIFTGWSTAASSGTAYAVGSSITMDGVKNLYAQWTPVGRIHVDIYKNGSTWANSGMGTGAYLLNTETNVKYTVTADPSYNYSYRTDSNVPYGTYALYINNGAGTVVESDYTVTLSSASAWVSPAYYQVTYSGNGATSGSAPASVLRLRNQTMPVEGQGTLAKTGYTFCYWTTSAQPHTPIIPGTSYTVPSVTTLYAKWYAGAYALGDVNANGKIDTSDARSVMQHAAGTVLLTGDQLLRADYDGNGTVNTADARLLLQAAAASTLSSNAELMAGGNQLASTGSIDWSSITWDDLDWDLLDLDAIDWDTFTMDELFRILLGRTSGNEVM